MKKSKEDKVNYGLKLKGFREDLNLTQEEVVKKAMLLVEEWNKGEENPYKVCFNQTQLSNWEKGKYFPHHINRFLLSVIYNIPQTELEFNYPKEEKDLLNYVRDLVEEDKSYIEKDNMIFESSRELEEIIPSEYTKIQREAFKNGTKLNYTALRKITLNVYWNTDRKIQYIIDLHIIAGLKIPEFLIKALNENDKDKKEQMYYEFYIGFYNGALYGNKQRHKEK